VEWFPVAAMTNPKKPWLVDLRAALGGEQRVAYLRTYVFCPREQDVRAELGSDDAVKMWVNGVLEHANLAARGVTPGDDVVPIRFYVGWNSVLLKIVQGKGDWGAVLRLVNADGSRIEGIRFALALTSEEEIQRVPPPPARCVLRWGLDDNLTGDAAGASSATDVPETKGNPVTAQGAVGACLAFDGLHDEVRARVSGLPVDSAAAWSLNVFVYMDEIPEPLTILAGFGDVTSGRPVGCQRYLCNFAGGMHFWGSMVDVNTGIQFDLGRWQMVTVTYDGDVLAMYRDGEKLIESLETLAPCKPVAALAPLDHWQKERRFGGRLDEFSIWRGVLTAEQIADLSKGVRK